MANIEAWPAGKPGALQKEQRWEMVGRELLAPWRGPQPLVLSFQGLGVSRCSVS